MKRRNGKSLSINLTSNKDYVDFKESYIYTITCTNISNQKVYNLSLFQTLLAQINIKYCSIDYKQIEDLNKTKKIINFKFDELDINETKEIEVVVSLNNLKDVEKIESLIEAKANLNVDLKEDEFENSIYEKSDICIVNKKIEYLKLIECSDINEAIVGEKVIFKILAKNKSNYVLDDVVISNMLKPELKLLENTIKLNNVKTNDQNIMSGINIGRLEINEEKELEFEVEIVFRPLNGVTKTKSNAIYNYKLPNEKYIRGRTAASNSNVLMIQIANLSIKKYINKFNISLDDEIEMNIEIFNDGTVQAKNIVFKEIIDNTFELIENSIYIDDELISNVNLLNGIIIGNLDSLEKRFVKYKMKFINGNTVSESKAITSLNFCHKHVEGLTFKWKKIEKEMSFNTNATNFKHIFISDIIYKKLKNPKIVEVTGISVNVKNLKYHIIKTMNGKSNEGEILTGNKIIIQGLLNVLIEYTTDNDENSVYSLNENLTFSTFIVLPAAFKIGSAIQLDYKVEDTSVKKRNNESIYTNIGMLLLAKIKPYNN